MTRAWAVIPAKCFARGKSRLAPVLSERARAELSRDFLEHVLGVAAASASLEGVVVATECDDVAAVARAHGALVHRLGGVRVPETRLGPLVDEALDAVVRRGAERVVVLMSDLPLLAAADVDAVVALLDGAPVVLAPDTRDEGTNALALRMSVANANANARAFRPTCFGNTLSFSLHAEAAARAGEATAVYRSARIALDIDTPADLASFHDGRRDETAVRVAKTAPTPSGSLLARLGARGTGIARLA